MLDEYIALGQLYPSFAQAFDFPALQGKACLESILNKIVKFGLFIQCYRAGRFAGLFVFFRGHPEIIPFITRL